MRAAQHNEGYNNNVDSAALAPFAFVLGMDLILLLQGKIPEGMPQIFVFLKRHLVGHCFQDSHFFCGVSGLSFMACRNKWIKLVRFVIIYKKRALIIVSLIIKLKNCCKYLV